MPMKCRRLSTYWFKEVETKLASLPSAVGAIRIGLEQQTSSVV